MAVRLEVVPKVRSREMVQRLREIFESVEREGTWSFVDSFQAQADSGDPEIVLLFVSKEAS